MVFILQNILQKQLKFGKFRDNTHCEYDIGLRRKSYLEPSCVVWAPEVGFNISAVFKNLKIKTKTIQNIKTKTLGKRFAVVSSINVQQ